MAAGWNTEETRTFLGIWGATDVQAQLDGIVRNQAIYEKIVAEMRDARYERTWKHCKTKRNNMVQRYRKVCNNMVQRYRKVCNNMVQRYRKVRNNMVQRYRKMCSNMVQRYRKVRIWSRGTERCVTIWSRGTERCEYGPEVQKGV